MAGPFHTLLHGDRALSGRLPAPAVLLTSRIVRQPDLSSAGGRVCRNGSADLLLWAPAQPHSSAATRTGRAFVDELDPGSLQRRDDPRQRLDHPADRAVAR